jgi:cation/acetate symporter
MNVAIQPLAIIIFAIIVALVLGISFYMSSRAKSASGYFAAGGQIHWGVNGLSFSGDYLSAASFLGIAGMIATSGYDGFLYSIGYLAGWVVALFVVAEPMKRLGKYTFTDALDSRFDSKAIQLTAAISTLIVSIFYLIPQMVGAGVLVTPLLGLPHYMGVIMVGVIVILIVATAGMTSTTWVQFLKGTLLIIFSLILVVAVLFRGLSTEPDQGGKVPFYKYAAFGASVSDGQVTPDDAAYQVVGYSPDGQFVKMANDKMLNWWYLHEEAEGYVLYETQWKGIKPNGGIWINGAPATDENGLRLVSNLEIIRGEAGESVETGRVGAIDFLAIMGDENSVVRRWKPSKFQDGEDNVTVYYPVFTSGDRIMRPGLKFDVEGTPVQKLNFVSLMLALFCGTAALPHILIRYYTVPTPAAARKSTIVAIAAIGFFYILTLYMGLGAMANAVVNLESNNMSAPLLARSFGTVLFACISAVAFATVLGTVSGLIIAASGAVAHDLMDRFLDLDMDNRQLVMAGKVAAILVGLVAIILGIIFEGVNVSFLVGWAFAVAAAANLPAIIMLLFWKRTTSQGIASSIVVGITVSLGIILVSPTMFTRYGLSPDDAWIALDNPGIIAIPLSFLTCYVVSLMTHGYQNPDAKA